MLRKLDPILAIALILALVFSLYGIQWGRVECWNRDQMALRALHGAHGLRPHNYLKPPFHTYLNHCLVLRPIDQAERLANRLPGRQVNLNEMRLLESRLLVVGMFLGTIVLAFAISRQAYGLPAARLIALVFATSAGFIAYDHFLSCDSPLFFWMMLSLFFSQRITSNEKISNYVLAGFLTGIATATKYNGLAVGIAIVAAHLSSTNRHNWRDTLFSWRLIMALAMVPIGFFAGNPYALFDFRKFVTDFIYNYKVTPHYGGQTTGYGYWQFFDRIVEVLGRPGSILIAAAVLLSLLVVVMRRDFRRPDAVGFALAGSVFALYFAKIGAFPRMETRFVLPAVPFAILMAGPFLKAMAARQNWIFVIFVPLLLYNSLCCIFVGKRFTEEPRTAAQSWIVNHVAAGSVIESSAGSPHWKKLPGLNAVELDATDPEWSQAKSSEVIDLRMPHVNGRAQLFAQIFQNDPWLADYAKQMEGNPSESLFTLDELLKRNPKILTVYSSDYGVPSALVRKYYSDLLDQEFPYDIVFDAEAKEAPRWVYPLDIDFLRGRMTILVRRPGT